MKWTACSVHEYIFISPPDKIWNISLVEIFLRWIWAKIVLNIISAVFSITCTWTFVVVDWNLIILIQTWGPKTIYLYNVLTTLFCNAGLCRRIKALSSFLLMMTLKFLKEVAKGKITEGELVLPHLLCNISGRHQTAKSFHCFSTILAYWYCFKSPARQRTRMLL